MHTLHTHSMAAHGRSTGALNTPVATQWLGQRLCYSLVQLIGYGNSINIVWRYFRRQINPAGLYWLVNLHQTPPNFHAQAKGDPVKKGA